MILSFCYLNVGALSLFYSLRDDILIEVSVLQGIHLLITGPHPVLVVVMISLATMHTHISQMEAILTRMECCWNLISQLAVTIPMFLKTLQIPTIHFQRQID